MTGCRVKGMWMGKLGKLISAIGLLAKRPYLINRVIDDDGVWQRKLEKRYGRIAFPEIAFGNICKTEMRVYPYAFLEGGSLPTDLALLCSLATAVKDCRYFEIGTWRGESVANVAEVAGKCTTMNLSPAQMLGMGLDADYVNQHAMYSKGVPNVTHIEADSAAYDFAVPGEKFDLIFIDGDHHYASIRHDTEQVFAHLMHSGTVIVWHDYAWQPGNVRHETMAAILDAIPKDHHHKLYAVRNTLCAIFHPGEFITLPSSGIALKEEAFELILKQPGREDAG
jgi:predicted O-methyltransferase YrrM